MKFQIIYLHSVIFELELIRKLITPEIDKKATTLIDETKLASDDTSQETTKESSDEASCSVPIQPIISSLDRRGSQGTRCILLQGEMRFIEDINALIFLCSPLYVLNSDPL